MKIILEQEDVKTGAPIESASLEDFKLNPETVEEADLITKHWLDGVHPVYVDLKNRVGPKSTWHNDHPHL